MSNIYYMASQTVENYIKTVYQLAQSAGPTVSSSLISEKLKTTSASVTDMLRKLASLSLIHYEKYRGVQLTAEGKSMAVELLRKHRLWETFLYEKLKIRWDLVHEIAEQLEHVSAPGLIEQLDEFLANPKFDPHGDPIPDARGRFTLRNQVLLNTLEAGDKGTIVGVKTQESEFLIYLQAMGLILHSSFQVREKMSYDESMKIIRGDGDEIQISLKTAQNLFIRKHSE